MLRKEGVDVVHMLCVVMRGVPLGGTRTGLGCVPEGFHSNDIVMTGSRMNQ